MNTFEKEINLYSACQKEEGKEENKKCNKRLYKHKSGTHRLSSAPTKFLH
jgi:hypothetical protein